MTCNTSHDDVLRNMGVTGRKFIDKHQDQVTEMKRTMLAYMQATRLEPGQQADADASQPQVTLNAKGYPTIPKEVTEQQISKAATETMFRTYMNRHYCE